VIGSKYQVTSDVPPDLSSMQVPERVLQKRLVARGAKTIMQVLIKWSALRETLSTWEDLQAIKQRFPAAPAWGPAVAQEEGGVTTADMEHVTKGVSEPVGQRRREG
jgi:hypothetical protein